MLTLAVRACFVNAKILDAGYRTARSFDEREASNICADDGFTICLTCIESFSQALKNTRRLISNLCNVEAFKKRYCCSSAQSSTRA